MRGRARLPAAVCRSLIILLACRAYAVALDPALDISQYAHTAWKVREGFSKGYINAITQTPDGYLWLGTEYGLVRFDGVRTVAWEPPTNDHLPSSIIRALLTSHDGRLWIGTDSGLASWDSGKLTRYPELDGQDIFTIVEDRQGTVWAGGMASPTGRLCAIQKRGAHCYGEDGRLGKGVRWLYEGSEGTVWAAADTGLWRLKLGSLDPVEVSLSVPEIHTLNEGDNGALLIGTIGGIKQLVHGKAAPYSVAPTRSQVNTTRLLRDRDGGLWIGTRAGGLLHVRHGKTDFFANSDGLSGDAIRTLFEDREGNIWVGTTDGLDRFRDFAVPTISVKQGLSNPEAGSIWLAKDTSVWIGTVDGLNRWNKGQITVYRKQPLLRRQKSEEFEHEMIDKGLPNNYIGSILEDHHGRIWVSTPAGTAYFENGRFLRVDSVPNGYVHSMAEDRAGDIWLAADQALIHPHQGRVVEQIPWTSLGGRGPALALEPDLVQGGIWLGFLRGGVAYFRDGRVRASYGSAEGLGEGRVNSFRVDQDRTLWAATEGGVSRLKDGRIATLTSKNGLPCNNVNWVMEDDVRDFWLYTACGLVRIARADLEAWVANPKRTIEPTVLDTSDGVRSHAFPAAFAPRVAKTADGKLWFLPLDGISVFDPRHLTFNKLPPPVHIEQITGDGKTYDAMNGLRLPPRVRSVAIDYTALSLIAPEKVHFRYKLEGQNRTWHERVNDREVQYTNLAPGTYRFRVMASNNSGVWNEEGASLEFVIPPAWYQTNWFRSLCVAVFIAVVWILHQLRLRQVALQFNRTLDARVGERTRIARELHDTLLQSFHGLLFRLQSVLQLLPERPIDARERLESTINQTAEAITEARDAVQGLRSLTVSTNELAVALKTLGEELAINKPSSTSPQFRVEVFGTSRELHPIVRDEVYRIATEALHNTFSHAHAQLIEVEIRYNDRELLVTVRDDGKGIDSHVLAGKGKAGHYGLPGMHERAKLVGGELEVWSEINAGTEIQLTIPAANAYAKPAPRGWWIGRPSRKGKEKEANTES